MTTIRFEKDLSEFQSIVMLYRDEENNVYIGNTSFYGGSIPERQCLNILFRHKSIRTKRSIVILHNTK